MRRSIKLLPSLCVIVALATVLPSCESSQEMDDCMERVAGEYVLAQFPAPSDGSISVKYSKEIDAASKARLFRLGDEWYFEYTLPLFNGDAFRFHHIQQRVIWDRQLGAYYFFRLRDSDLPEGWDTDGVNIAFRDRVVVLTGNQLDFSWTPRD